MKKQKALIVLVLLFTLVLGAAKTFANLTLSLNSVSLSSGNLTIDGATGSALSLMPSTTTGNIVLGAALTSGSITIGHSTQTGGTEIYGNVGGGAANQLFPNQTSGGLIIGPVSGGNSVQTTIGAGTGGLYLATTTDARTIDIGTGPAAQTWDLGTGNAVQTVHLFDNDTPANILTLGGNASTLTIKGSSILIGNTSGGLGYYEKTSAPSGNVNISTAQSGTVFYIGHAGDNFTLPAPASGLVYRFVVNRNFSTTGMFIDANGGASIIQGTVFSFNDAVTCSNNDSVDISASGESLGDWYELRSDGTNWYLSGETAGASAFTCANG